MNMQSSVVKVSIILVGFLCSEALFGMKNDLLNAKAEKEIVLYPQLHTLIPVDIIISVAACAHDTVKYNMSTTCKSFHATVSPTNIVFVTHPLFTASPDKINSMAIFNGWYNNQVMMKALKKHLPDEGDDGSVVMLKNFTECRLDGNGIVVSCLDAIVKMEYLGQLRDQYNTSNLGRMVELSLGRLLDRYNYDVSNTEVKMAKREIALVLLCAALCDDIQAIQKIVPMIKILYARANVYAKNDVYKSVMEVLMKRNNKEAFEFMVQHDPYEIRNYYAPELHHYEKRLLDVINNSKHEDVDAYQAICRKYGEKTNRELNPNECIVS